MLFMIDFKIALFILIISQNYHLTYKNYRIGPTSHFFFFQFNLPLHNCDLSNKMHINLEKQNKHNSFFLKKICLNLEMNKIDSRYIP